MIIQITSVRYDGGKPLKIVSWDLANDDAEHDQKVLNKL
jgi:hypothetical protein